MKKFSRKLIFSVISFVLAVVVIGTSIFTIAENAQRNIAIDADVYATTGDWYLQNNLGPEKMQDGQNGTYFSSVETKAQNTTEVVTLTFDDTYGVSKIVLKPRINGGMTAGIPVDFTVSAYNGSEWVEIFSENGNQGTNTEFNKDNLNVDCTAIRLVATKLSPVGSLYALQLAEFQVWGKKSDSKLAKPYILEDAENVAEGAAVDFDVPAWAQNDFPKTKITDGVVNEHKNFATTDALKENQKQEVYVTLDKVCKIDEISLYPAVQSVSGSLKYVGGFPVNYTLSVWNGSRWCEVGSEKDFSMSAYEAAANTVSAKKYKFDVIETNAIRLTVDKHSAVNTAGTQFALRLAEIMVNGLKTNKTDFNNPVYIKDYKDIELQKSDASDENNLIYTFDRTYAVKEVVLGGKEIASFPKQFSVSLWNGEEWQTIDKWDSFDIKNSKLHIAVDGINSRGIKITSNDALTDLDLSKAELVVRGNTDNTIVKPVSPVVNAALGATAEIDIPLWAQDGGLVASNLVDGKADTYITTAYSTSVDTQKTVTITLDGTYDIDTVNLYPRVKNGTVYGFPVDFTISAWDGTGWQIVKTVTDEAVPESDSLKSYEFTAVSCSAIKIDVTKLGESDNTDQYVLQLAELEALGIISDATIAPPGASGDGDDDIGSGDGDNEGDDTPSAPTGVNAALNGTVSMQVPSWATNFKAENLVDGSVQTNVTTEFYSEQNTTESATVVFKDGAYDISTIMLYPRVVSGAYGGGFPVDFTVSTWDGTKWVKVYEKTDFVKDNANPFRIDLDTAILCNAVKVEATKLDKAYNDTKYTLQFAELEAYGDKSSSSITPPQIENDEDQDSGNGGSGNEDNNGGDNEGSNTPSVPLGDNAALNGTVSMQVPSWATNFKAENLVDGSVQTNVTTEFYSEQNTTESATVVFKNGAYDISTIMLYPRVVSGAYGGGFPVDFTVSTWDGTKWVKVYEKTDFVKDNANPLRIDLDTAVLCNAVKVEATKLDKAYNDTKYTLQFAEVEAYGDKSSSSITPPQIEKDEDQDSENGGSGEGDNEGSNTPSVPQGDNAALNGTVSMQVPSWAKNFKAENLVDGSTQTAVSTEFYTEQNTAESVTVVFKNGAYKIKTLMLYPRVVGGTVYGFPTDFTISAWNGTEWVKVHERTGLNKNTAQPVTIELDKSVLCNAIKIDVTKLGKSDNSGKPYTLQFAEVEAYGDKSNVSIATPQTNGSQSGDNESSSSDTDAAEKPVGDNASLNGNVSMKVPSWATNFKAVNLVDGSTATAVSTEFYTEQNTAESVTVVFKNGAYNIKTIMLYPRVVGGTVYGFPTDFTISAWNGTEWVKVHERTGLNKNTAQPVTIKLDTPVVCNAIKIDVTKLGKSDNAGKPYTLQLTEVEAYGDKSNASITAPSVDKSESNTNTESEVAKPDGENAALGGNVSMEVPKWAENFQAKNLVDGSIAANSFATTEYYSEQKTKESASVVFKDGAYTIKSIMLYPRVKGDKVYGFPIDFTVSTWNGTEWVKVYERTGLVKNTAEPVRIDLETPVICNAIKIDATKLGEADNAGKYTLQLAEIEAYGEKSSKTLVGPSASAGTDNTTGAVTLNNDGNLALNKPIKASSDLAQYNAPVTKANDGDIVSYWASNDTKFVKGEPQWIEINLLNNYAVNKVVLGARQNALGFPYDFDIEVFYNGEWKKAYSVTGFEANEKAGYTAYEFTFSAVIGNKVRVSSANFRKVGSSNSMVLSEVAVYGDKVSGNYVLPNENMITSGVGITATSSMEDYDYYIAHLIDNSLTTAWSTVPSVEMTPQTVEVDMKCEVQLSEIQIKPGYMGYGFPIDFTISVYENGKWVNVYTAKDYKQPKDEAIQRFQFDKRNATKFRITATKLPMQAGLYVWKMNEIVAYPLHTGDEFDPNSTEITTSLKKNDAAKVVAVKGSEKLKVEISWWKIIAGSVLTLVAVLGCVAMLIILKKRKLKF